jgi:decaprenylphospho-beta-D-erythro-pentofuranosid-2-ulose 2-reductase
MTVSVSQPPRTALVLGGSSDIAQAILQQLTAEGLEAAVLASRSQPTTTPEGLLVHGIDWDATSVSSHEALVDKTVALLGSIDLVICAVGLLGHQAGRSMGPEAVMEMALVNFGGPAAALGCAARQLERQGQGTIIVLSSVAAARPRKSNFVYGASKAGLDAFALGLSDALADTNVNVVVVRPGFVRSKMTVGLKPAPFATTPQAVAERVVMALRRNHRGVVWVPPILGPLFGALRQTPAPVWRRIAGDR